MRKTTQALREQLARAEQDDERVVADLQSWLAELDVVMRDAEERRLIRIGEAEEHHTALMMVCNEWKGRLRGMIARQRGEPVAIVVENEPAKPAPGSAPTAQLPKLRKTLALS